MSRLSKVLFTALTLGVFTAPALAQEAGEEDPGMEADGTEADGSMDASTDPAVPVADVSATAAPIGSWSKSIINRSPTLAPSLLRVDAGFEYLRLSFFEPITMTSLTADAGGLIAGAGYGVSDKLEVGGAYGITLFEEFEAKGPLSIYSAYNLINDGKLRVAGVGRFTYNLASESGGLSAGLSAYYNVNDKLTVYTGGGNGGAPTGDHLNLTLIGPEGSSKPITFDVPFGVGFQATPELFAFVETQLASFNISDSANAFIFADITPVRIGAFYAVSNTLDVGAALTFPSIEDAGDLFGIGVAARFFMGDAVKASAPSPAVASM